MTNLRACGLAGLAVAGILLSLMNGGERESREHSSSPRQQQNGASLAESGLVLQPTAERPASDGASTPSTIVRAPAPSGAQNQGVLGKATLGRDAAGLPDANVLRSGANELLDPDTLLERTRELVESLDDAPWESSLPLFLDEVRLLVSSYASGRRYSEALMLLDQIESRARLSAGLASIQEPLTELRSSLETRREQFAAFVDAEQTLAIFPDDADAHLAVGLWMILERDDWDQAVVHLARSGETSLWQEPAALELAAEPDARAIADAWWHLGSRLAQIDPFRQKLLLRSRYWERQAGEATARANR
jgi:hypothetical protein